MIQRQLNIWSVNSFLQKFNNIQLICIGVGIFPMVPGWFLRISPCLIGFVCQCNGYVPRLFTRRLVLEFSGNRKIRWSRCPSNSTMVGSPTLLRCSTWTWHQCYPRVSTNASTKCNYLSLPGPRSILVFWHQCYPRVSTNASTKCNYLSLPFLNGFFALRIWRRWSTEKVVALSQ